MNLDNLILLLLLVIIVGYFGKCFMRVEEEKQQENFFIDGTYPVTHQVVTSPDSVNDAITSEKLTELTKILQVAKDYANKDIINPIRFNHMYLPVTMTQLSPIDVKPITDYLLASINKLGKGVHILNLVDVINIRKEETERQSLIRFRMVCDYKVKLNGTHFHYRRTRPTRERENNLIIECVMVSEREIIDDIFEAKKTNMDRVYVARLHIVDTTPGDFLPGYSEGYYPNNMYPYTLSLTNRISPYGWIASKKRLNQEEVGNITREIETADPKLDFDFTKISTTNEDDKFKNLTKIHVKNPAIGAGWLDRPL